MRSAAQRGHEDQSVHEACSAACTDVSEWPLSDQNMLPLLALAMAQKRLFIHALSVVSAHITFEVLWMAQ